MTETLLHVPLLAKFPGQEGGRTVDDPAALTAFRDVVRGTRHEKQERFTRSQVLASKQPVTGDLRDRYEAAVEDADRFFQPSRAVYEPADVGVRKIYSWGDAVGAVDIPYAGAVGEARTADRGRLAAAFESVGDAGVRRPSSDGSDAGTREQLEALGYF
jgi:hypothetical protein